MLSSHRKPEPRLKLVFLECLELNSWESGPEEEHSFLRACWEVSQLGWLTLVAMHAIEFSQNASRPVGECHLEPGMGVKIQLKRLKSGPREKSMGQHLPAGVMEGKVCLCLCEPLQLWRGQLSIAGGMCWSQGPQENWQEGSGSADAWDSEILSLG